MKLELTTKSGLISAYGLACGYTESKPGKGGSTQLWMEHGVFHVRKHDFDTGQRIFWKSFSTLAEARRAFAAA
ncbi:hypothetical protein LCGC14_2977100 [marine sediment metagenome]|uniref:WGR domain-containing protein n=1 Tax=marine sediment metagenome TaxID=412755 RepID=A0A0F8ZYY0_9ZZZZ